MTWPLRHLWAALTSWAPVQGTSLLSLSHPCWILLDLQVSAKCQNLLFQPHSSSFLPLKPGPVLHPSFSCCCAHCCFLGPFLSLVSSSLSYSMATTFFMSLFAITTSALGKLGEMNLLCDKLNINSSKKHFEVFVCVCIFICQMNHLSYKKCGREKSNGNDNMITAHNSHKSSISVTHK